MWSNFATHMIIDSLLADCNLTGTLAHQPCLSHMQVVGREYNNLELDKGGDLETYETVYALLDHLSPGYQKSFQHALSDKLEQMEQTANTTSEVRTPANEVDLWVSK